MGTTEVDIKSGRPRKPAAPTARRIVTKVSQTPSLTTEDLQEGLADSGIMLHCSITAAEIWKSHQKTELTTEFSVRSLKKKIGPAFLEANIKLPEKKHGS